jgi:cysteinyl-tRNA synthetase
MSMKHLGETFDLHGGGLDLVFPHHENEIAQSECATGKPLARYWMHNGFVQVQKEKMSKSLGNFFVLRQAYECVEPEAVRYAMLTVHYRAPLNFEWEVDDAGKLRCFPLLDEAEGRLEYIYATRQRLAEIAANKLTDDASDVPEGIAEFASRMKEALNDDLNTPVALAHTALFLKHANELCDRAQGKKGSVPAAWHRATQAGFEELGAVLGIGAQEPQTFARRIRDRRAKAAGIEPSSIEQKLQERSQARADKDYARSDAIRAELTSQGVEIYDSVSGTTDWRLLRSSG